MNLEQSVLIDPFKGKIKENKYEEVKIVKFENKKIKAFQIEAKKIIKKTFPIYMKNNYISYEIFLEINTNNLLNSTPLNSNEINLFLNYIPKYEKKNTKDFLNKFYGVFINELLRKSHENLGLMEYNLDFNERIDLQYIGTQLKNEKEEKPTLIINGDISNFGFNNTNWKFIVNGNLIKQVSMYNNNNCEFIINGNYQILHSIFKQEKSKNCKYFLNGNYKYIKGFKIDSINCEYIVKNKTDFNHLSLEIKKGNIIRLIDKNGKVLEEIEK